MAFEGPTHRKVVRNGVIARTVHGTTADAPDRVSRGVACPPPATHEAGQRFERGRLPHTSPCTGHGQRCTGAQHLKRVRGRGGAQCATPTARYLLPMRCGSLSEGDCPAMTRAEHDDGAQMRTSEQRAVARGQTGHGARATALSHCHRAVSFAWHALRPCAAPATLVPQHEPLCVSPLVGAARLCACAHTLQNLAPRPPGRAREWAAPWVGSFT